jgi:hypothetical protein
MIDGKKDFQYHLEYRRTEQVPACSFKRAGEGGNPVTERQGNRPGRFLSEQM